MTERSKDSTAVPLSDIGIEEILENFELTQIDAKIVQIVSLLGDIDLIGEIRGDPGFRGSSIRDTDVLGAIDNDDQETMQVAPEEEELISETERPLIVTTIQYFVTSESQSLEGRRKESAAIPVTGTEIPLESKNLTQLFRSIIEVAVQLNNKKLEIAHDKIDTTARKVCLSGQDASLPPHREKDISSNSVLSFDNGNTLTPHDIIDKSSSRHDFYLVMKTRSSGYSSSNGKSR